MVELIETTRRYDNIGTCRTINYKVDADESILEDEIEPRACGRCGDVFKPKENPFRQHCIPCLEGIKI